MTAAIAGISDEQLAALVAGRWVDDTNYALPAWERRILFDDEDGGGGRRREWQQVYPFLTGHRWHATSGPREKTCADSLEEALKWCEDRAGNYEIAPPFGTATKQEERFAEAAAPASAT